jgi:uncharacterized lipoprotein
VKRILSRLLIVMLSAALLSGCGYLRTKFGKKDVYKKSTQSQPLEVPPDLDSPNRSGTLLIPEPGTPTTAGTSDARVPDAMITPTAAPPVSASLTATGDGLQLADTLANTYRRVGFALERSGVATILSRDEAARSYDIRTTGQTRKSPGWFKRAITLGMADDKKVSTPVQLRVDVTGTDGASKVMIEGAASESERSAAKRVLEILNQRMQ